MEDFGKLLVSVGIMVLSVLSVGFVSASIYTETLEAVFNVSLSTTHFTAAALIWQLFKDHQFDKEQSFLDSFLTQVAGLILIWIIFIMSLIIL